MAGPLVGPFRRRVPRGGGGGKGISSPSARGILAVGAGLLLLLQLPLTRRRGPGWGEFLESTAPSLFRGDGKSAAAASATTTATAAAAATGLSPLFSTVPLTRSLHPTHRLWTEMSEAEQDVALDHVGSYLTKYAGIIKPPGLARGELQSVKQGECVFDAGIGSTGHTLCGPPPGPPCHFLSFGINDDPSWDIEVANRWGCRGFAGDPTVSLPSKIHPNVTFHNIGATVLQDNEERLNDKGGAGEWWMTSFPRLRYFLGLERIDVLKIDCEGCEVAMSRDILREDPGFLFHVDQISIETHVTRTWMTSREHVYYFALMFPLLEEAGFRMEWSSVFGCSKRHEVAGCVPELGRYGWPCGYEPWPGHPNVVHGESCQEFTWKRY